MNSNKRKTPSKDELLDELESIRDFLKDEEGLGDIPTLTAVAESPTSKGRTGGSKTSKTDNSSEPPSKVGPESGHTKKSTPERNVLKEPGEELELELELDLEFEQTDEYHSLSSPEDGDAAPAQTQKSLFEDDAAPASEINAEHNSQDNSKSTGIPKARGENPFLPPHIRERLGRHKELFESVPEDIALAMAQREGMGSKGELFASLGSYSNNQFSASEIESMFSTTGAGSFDKEALIDALIAEYLPQIEAKLRAKLREITLKDNK